jgi:arsenite methyltransferase
MEVDRASAEVWASWFRALGDASRVLILHELAVARRPMTVGEIVTAVDVGQSTVSHHLKLLADTGFVHVERRGTASLYRVNERCLEVFPSAAEVVMGQLPRYDASPAACVPPWQCETPEQTREDESDMTDDALVDSLKAHYGAAARKAGAGLPVIEEECGTSDCCGPAARDTTDTLGAGLYDASDVAELPAGAVAGSIGCANPVALARLEPGEDVLDLGSGGGIDVLLSARRVGPTGRAYGVDMTAEMLDLARANQAEAGVTNAEFLEGRIEAVPLPDGSVDVVVSNCVINLSADKPAVFAEAHRVLRPGGRVALADIAADEESSAELRADDAAWAACIAGAVTRDRYRSQLADAGFAEVEIVDSHRVADGFWSVFVRARKPGDDAAQG